MPPSSTPRPPLVVDRPVLLEAVGVGDDRLGPGGGVALRGRGRQAHAGADLLQPSVPGHLHAGLLHLGHPAGGGAAVLGTAGG